MWAWVDSAHVSPPELSSRQQPSLYRRHRPRNFDEVVGQQAVVRTLRTLPRGLAAASGFEIRFQPGRRATEPLMLR